MKPFWQLPYNSEVFFPMPKLKTQLTFQILLDCYLFEMQLLSQPSMHLAAGERIMPRLKPTLVIIKSTDSTTVAKAYTLCLKQTKQSVYYLLCFSGDWSTYLPIHM